MAVIDHLVYAVPDLARAIDWFEASTGVRPAVGGAHVGLGTHNALVSFGSCYLELIAPDPNQPDPDGPRPFGLDTLDGSALVAFAVRPSDHQSIDAIVHSARADGYDPGDIVAMSRATPDGGLLEWRLTFPNMDFGGIIPFVIDWGETPQPSSTQPGGVDLADLTLTDPDPVAAVSRLAALGVDIPVTTGPTSLSATFTGPSGSIHA